MGGFEGNPKPSSVSLETRLGGGSFGRMVIYLGP